MPGGSFLKSTAVRLAVIYIVLFVTASLGANIAAYQMVVSFLDERLNANVQERYREIASAFDARGLQGAVDMIDNHGPAIRGQETIYALRNPAGELLAGSNRFSDTPSGYSILEPDDHHGSVSHYKLFKGPLGPNTLVVGINSGDTDELARIVLISFGWATAIVLSMGMAGAAILAYRTRHRISSLTQIAHAIGHGELSRRLPVSSRMDEIDILSAEINVALARLESSVAALKQVTTDVAHDLKTPIGRTFLVLEDALNAHAVDEMRIGVETALEELRSIANTFDALLRIAQIEARSRTARFTAFDLCDVVGEIYETYEVIAAEEGYQLTMRDAVNGGWINGDPDLIRQLLTNLLSNAMRHTPVGSRIWLDVSREDGQVLLNIADNGPGISDEDRAQVFDRFYRVEKSRTTAGSGLGLSLVKAIAELHGAAVTLADNNPGLRVVVRFQELRA
ncbi:ATP-binding protein [Agrobacterium sp. NPDC090283]|uniref:sensor histidine kinase n=1 Tax=Agrobacterium sp. NPDC090283 TaxID=3363920 RepID=UPI00383A22AD